MIGRIRGRLLERRPGQVVVDVVGVGYVLSIPLSTFYRLSEVDGDETTLYVYTYVREEALQLFGFATFEEREQFERLLSVAGVGPKVALAVLSGIGTQELEATVRTGNRERLERIPGIGRKTAERILVDLRDRLDGSKRRSRRGVAPPGTPSWDGAESSPLRADAISALMNLGYPADRAGEAVEDTLGAIEGPLSLEDVLRGALRKLIR